MGGIVNLRRARKAKKRDAKAAEAGANRAKHGLSKGERAVVKARADKAEGDLTARKLDQE